MEIRSAVCSAIELRSLGWYNVNRSKEVKGENSMNAYAVKPNMPFATKKMLKRTPASRENRDMIEYMDSHEFSFRVDKETGKYISGARKK